MRPTAYILQDPYALHRRYWEDDWEPDPVGDTAWTDWDFALDKAFQIIEDYTDAQNGQLIWWDQSPEVRWEVRTRSSGHDAAVERKRRSMEEAGKEYEPGDSPYAVPVFDNPDNPPTMLSWLEMLEEEDGRIRPRGAQQGGRPPTAQEKAELRASRESRQANW